MKKHLLFISMVLVSFGAIAQSLPVLQKMSPVAPKKSFPVKNMDVERNATCANDTLHYAYAKELIQASPSFWGFGLLTGSTTMGSGYSQAYLNNTAITISGVEFWGFVQDDVNPSQSLNVNVSVYNVNATYQPTTLLGSTNLTITGSVDNFYTATFGASLTTSSNYAVVLTNPSTTDTLGIVINNASSTTYGETLGSIQYMGTWYSAITFLTPDDYEPIFAPIVSYPIATDYTSAPASICEGQTVNFTNTTTPAALTNRMANWNVFVDYFNYPSSTVVDSTYAWDMDDASAAIWSTNASHAFATANTYNVGLYTMGGFWKSCTDSKITPLTVTVCTGINEENKDAISVYPNPSNGLFTINMNTTSKSIIEVYNVIGEVVYTSQVTGTTATVDLSSLEAGVYSLKVTANNTNVVKSIVLTK